MCEEKNEIKAIPTGLPVVPNKPTGPRGPSGPGGPGT